jgi:hypothetical protein
VAFRPSLGYSEPLWDWALHVGIHIQQESRMKANEVIIGRSDIAATALYEPDAAPKKLRVVVVRNSGPRQHGLLYLGAARRIRRTRAKHD